MGFAFLAQLGKVALSAVLGSVFKAETFLGSGAGETKKAYALTDVSNTLIANPLVPTAKVPEAAEAIKMLIDGVVGVLNAVGLFDDKPGLELNFTTLIPAAQAAYEAIKAVIAIFSDEPV